MKTYYLPFEHVPFIAGGGLVGHSLVSLTLIIVYIEPGVLRRKINA